MPTWTLLSLAVGLAMDATAVALTSGCVARQVRIQDALLLAVLFGGFQAGMPLLGWSLGMRFEHLIAAWDHWLAFGLLSAIGGKLLWDARQGSEAGERSTDNPFGPAHLVVLAFITSIDALAAGITLHTLDQGIGASVLWIGVITFGFALAGVWLGRRVGTRWNGRLDALGGVVLIALGTRTLLEHLGYL